MIKKTAYFLLLLVALTTTSYSQETYEGGLLKNFGVAAKGGLLYGGGVDFSTSLHPNLKLRVGYNYFGLDASRFFDTDGDEKINEASANFSNGNVLIDYFPVRKGIFHLTAGMYLGHNKINVTGSGFNEFAINDYVIKPDPETGEFCGTIKFGSALKPYVGIGLGRTLTKSRVGFKFELGMVYQGNFKVESPYLDPDADSGDVEDSVNIDLLESKVWPMMTISISYRIK